MCIRDSIIGSGVQNLLPVVRGEVGEVFDGVVGFIHFNVDEVGGEVDLEQQFVVVRVRIVAGEGIEDGVDAVGSTSGSPLA